MNEKRLSQIKESILETIKDPMSPNARKTDCYANCAQYLHEASSDDYSIMIYGHSGYPFHGVVVDDKTKEIVVDTFSSKRTEFSGEKVIYNDKGKEIELELLDKMQGPFEKNINELEAPEFDFELSKEKKPELKNSTKRKPH